MAMFTTRGANDTGMGFNWKRYISKTQTDQLAVLLTLGAHAQRGLQYLVCVSVCVCVCLSVCLLLNISLYM